MTSSDVEVAGWAHAGDQAVRVRAADNLLYEDVPDPEPAGGQARVAVEAAGVHLIDTKIRQGGSWGPSPDLPMTPGREIAGKVEALGAGVAKAWLGKRVVGHLGMASGGYAEKAVIAAASLHEIPEHVSAAAAVASIGTGRTTLVALDLAAVTDADVVLVTAAAGGIGNLLVQLAGRRGATVIGLAGGADKVARVRQLGADVALDYSEPDWPDRVRAARGGRAATLVMDGVGGAPLDLAAGLLRRGGRVVSFGWASGQPSTLGEDDLAERGIRQLWVVGPKAPPMDDMRELETRALGYTADGTWVPLLNPPYRLAEAAAAHTALENRATVGKVVLVP
ncbi:MAG: zinc-binding dehydrogenase [Geodermatophilaceae bacterium]